MASKPVASLCLIEKIKNSYFHYLVQSIRRRFFQRGAFHAKKSMAERFNWGHVGQRKMLAISFRLEQRSINEKSMVPDIEHEEYYPSQVFQFPAIPALA